MISQNPLDYVSYKDLIELGLTPDEILTAHQPSKGGVYHTRGAESKGKSLWIAHFYRNAIDFGIEFEHAVGNMEFKGKYSNGYEVLKGDDIRQFLWDMTHKPYRNSLAIIDEIDSEFPARMFPDKEQTEIALRLWHTAKLGNYILSSSHIGNSTDIIIHLATHYFIYPYVLDFKTQTLKFDVVNSLDGEISEGWIAEDIVKTMLIYSRQELTENTDEETNKPRPVKKSKKRQRDYDTFETDLDLEAELNGLC